MDSRVSVPSIRVEFPAHSEELEPRKIIEYARLEAPLNARHIRHVQIINGLKPYNLVRTVEGEPVGTTIYVMGA